MKVLWNGATIDVVIDSEFLKAAKAQAQADAMKARDIELADILADPNLASAVTADIEARVLAAALASPRKSGITSQDPAFAKTIEAMTDLVDTADAINGQFGSDIVLGATAADKYTVKFRGQLYAYDLSVKGVEKALGRLKNILIHHPHVIVEAFKQDPAATPLQACLNLQTFIACRMNRFIGMYELQTVDGPVIAVVYTPKTRDGAAYRGDEIAEDVDEDDEW